MPCHADVSDDVAAAEMLYVFLPTAKIYNIMPIRHRIFGGKRPPCCKFFEKSKNHATFSKKCCINRKNQKKLQCQGRRADTPRPSVAGRHCLSWGPGVGRTTAGAYPQTARWQQFAPARTCHSVLSSSANFCAMVGLFLVRRLMVRSSALLLARRRLFSEESRASFVFCR